jgi:putative FmdB family regulatory protein
MQKIKISSKSVNRGESNMPVYEFECPEGTISEKLVKMDTKQIKCPKCGKNAKKIMSQCAFELKGGGWYADGYSSKK